jgi:hypothetical protein
MYRIRIVRLFACICGQRTEFDYSSPEEFPYLFVCVLKPGQRAEFDCLGPVEVGFVSNPNSSISCLPMSLYGQTYIVQLFVCLCHETRPTCRVRLFGSCRSRFYVESEQLSVWPTYRVRLFESRIVRSFVCLCLETRPICSVRLFGSCRSRFCIESE